MAVRGGLTAKKPCISFFTDNDVEDCVADFLKDSGHSVVMLRDVMPSNSADKVVAINCRQHSLVLITHNVKHFKAISKQYEAKHGKVDILSRIEMECHQSMSKKRLEEFLPFIELEWTKRGKKKAGMRISIDRTMMRIHR